MEQNHNMLRGISENGGIVFYGVDSTEIVREMERLHKTSAVTTAALGRLLTAASMMGIMLKSTGCHLLGRHCVCIGQRLHKPAYRE